MKGLTVGQKRKTVFASSWRTSSFFTSEARRILRTENTRFALIVSSLLSGSILLFFLFSYIFTSMLYQKNILGTLSDTANTLLYCVTVCILLFACGFFLHGARCGMVQTCISTDGKSVFSPFLSADDCKKTFASYILTLVALSPIATLLVLTSSVLSGMRNFSVQSVIICGVMILTSLYLLCIIECVLTVHRYTFFMYLPFSDVLRLCWGHFGEYICLCIRTMPYIILGILSGGILLAFYTVPYISSCKYAFASYLYDIHSINDARKE